MQKCISCGKCTPQCPSARFGGVDPHEIMIMGDGDVSQCIECGTCSRVCRRTDPFTVIRDLKSIQMCKGYTDDYVRTGYRFPVDDCPGNDVPVSEWNGEDVKVMPGCVVKCRARFLENASCIAIKSVGKTCSELEGAGCCLRSSQFRNMTEFERRGIRISMVEPANGHELVTLCAGCSDELAGSSIESKNLIHFLYENRGSLPKFGRSIMVAVEPGCNAMEFKKEMNSVVEALGCEPIGNNCGCCGKDTDVSENLMKERMKECSGSSLIVVGCPNCFLKYDSREDGRPVVYIGELVAMAAGRTDSLKYHRIRIDLEDEDFYTPKDQIVRISEDRTRW